MGRLKTSSKTSANLAIRPPPTSAPPPDMSVVLSAVMRMREGARLYARTQHRRSGVAAKLAGAVRTTLGMSVAVVSASRRRRNWPATRPIELLIVEDADLIFNRSHYESVIGDGLRCPRHIVYVGTKVLGPFIAVHHQIQIPCEPAANTPAVNLGRPIRVQLVPRESADDAKATAATLTRGAIVRMTTVRSAVVSDACWQDAVAVVLRVTGKVVYVHTLTGHQVALPMGAMPPVRLAVGSHVPITSVHGLESRPEDVHIEPGQYDSLATIRHLV